jgi:hypothetical protein
MLATHGQLAYCMMSVVPSGSITPSARTQAGVSCRTVCHSAILDRDRQAELNALCEPDGAKLTARSSTTLPSLSVA